MVLQVGNIQIFMSALAFVIMSPNETDTDKIQIHFIGGTMFELATPELVSGYKQALAALRFGVGMQLPKSNSM